MTEGEEGGCSALLSHLCSVFPSERSSHIFSIGLHLPVVEPLFLSVNLSLFPHCLSFSLPLSSPWLRPSLRLSPSLPVNAHTIDVFPLAVATVMLSGFEFFPLCLLAFNLSDPSLSLLFLSLSLSCPPLFVSLSHAPSLFVSLAPMYSRLCPDSTH